jgi:hypothetical protein
VSTETLRKAAALMRERANAARDVTGASDWHIATAYEDGWSCYAVRSSGGRVSSLSAEEEATHIASWHPAVALAVADWLGSLSYADERANAADYQDALTVARAYLGGDA